MRAISIAAAVAAAAISASATPRLLAAVEEHKAGAGGRHSCGNDHPALQHKLRREAVVVPVEYAHTGRPAGEADEAPHGRRTQFVPISAANSAPMRIKLLFNQLDGTSDGTPPRVCTAGGTAQVDSLSGGMEAWTCTEEAIPSAARRDQVKKRLEWAVGRLQRSLQVKPATAPITISAALQAEFKVPAADATVTDTDLVIIAVAWPSPFIPAAGWATCLQRDQFKRCTVGYINIVPELVDVDGANSPATISDERHTALHELTHVLGGILPDGGHVGADGNPLSASDVWLYHQALPLSKTSAATDPKRVAVFIRSSRVLALAKAHFNCSSLPGVPLEDLPLGRGSHWEARVLGSEYMAYGTSSGETYVSDLSVAMLEDTGHYLAPDYSQLTGTLFEESSDAVAALTAKGFSEGTAVQDYTPPAPPSPGALRWGRGAGCGFVLGDPRLEWDERHLCVKSGEYSCSADNRLASVCIVRASVGVEKQYSCGRRDADGGCAAGPSASGCNADDRNCALPEEQQHFTSATVSDALAGVAGTPDRTGGFSAAMDFAPVRFGYWSCLYSSAASNTSSRAASESDGGVDFGSTVGDAASASSGFGGQTLCKDCRCFVSSLLELSKGVRPGAGVYGLCYAHNCYRPDYLQVAVRGGDGAASWYRCPPEGGRIFIPGFSGRIQCPPAKEFCANEKVTGIKFEESGFSAAIAIYAAAGAGVLVLLLCCACPPTRVCLNRCLRRRCGVEQLEPESFDEVERVWYKDKVPASPCKGLFVIVGNTFTATWGLFLGILAAMLVQRGSVVNAAMPFLVAGFSVAIVAVIGSVGIRSRAFGPSCFTLVYIYSTFLLACGFMVFVTTVALNDSSLTLQVKRTFDVVSDALPAGTINPDDPVDEQIKQATDFLRAAILPIGAIILGCVGVMVLSAVAAVTTVRRATMAIVTFNFVSWLSLVVGVAAIGIAARIIAQHSDAEGGSGQALAGPAGVGVAIGCCLVILAVLSLIAASKPRARWVVTALVVIITLVVAAGSLAAGGLAIANRANAGDLIGELSERQLALLQEFLGGGMTQAELILAVEAQVLNIGLAAMALAAAAVAHAASGITLLTVKPKQLQSTLAVAPSGGPTVSTSAVGN